MNKTITIFGSAIPKEDDAQYKFAYELGASLAKMDLISVMAVMAELWKPPQKGLMIMPGSFMV